jgi:hypothetical protein
MAYKKSGHMNPLGNCSQGGSVQRSFSDVGVENLKCAVGGYVTRALGGPDRAAERTLLKLRLGHNVPEKGIDDFNRKVFENGYRWRSIGQCCNLLIGPEEKQLSWVLRETYKNLNENAHFYGRDDLELAANRYANGVLSRRFPWSRRFSARNWGKG